MARSLPLSRLVALALLLAVGGGIALVTTNGLGVEGQIYSVAQVEAGLHQNQAQWVGRVVRIQAVFVPGITSCGVGSACIWIDEPMLVDVPRGRLAVNFSGGAVRTNLSLGSLALRPGPQNQMLTVLRRLPVLDSLLPGPRFQHPGTTYLVKLGSAGANIVCLGPPCYQATLLDGTLPSTYPGTAWSTATLVGSTLILQPSGAAADSK